MAHCGCVRGKAVGLSWQQGPLSDGAIGRFLVPESLLKRLLYVEPLRRSMRAPRGAWQHVDLPAYASELKARVAFAWRAMDAFYEEDERILGHAADSYHRIDIRQTSRHLVVHHGDRIVADTKRPLVLYESGFAPRWYVPRTDINESALTAVDHQTFCPHKGLCRYYDIGDARHAAWSYRQPYTEVGRISDFVSFEPDIVSVQIDGTQIHLEPGQTVIPHGPDRNLTVAEALPRKQP